MLEAHRWSGLCVGSNPFYWKARARQNCKIVNHVPNAPFLERKQSTFGVGKNGAARGHAQTARVPLDKVLRDMQAPRVIDYVTGPVWQLLAFPWDEYEVSA